MLYQQTFSVVDVVFSTKIIFNDLDLQNKQRSFKLFTCVFLGDIVEIKNRPLSKPINEQVYSFI